MKLGFETLTFIAIGAFAFICGCDDGKPKENAAGTAVKAKAAEVKDCCKPDFLQQGEAKVGEGACKHGGEGCEKAGMGGCKKGGEGCKKAGIGGCAHEEKKAEEKSAEATK